MITGALGCGDDSAPPGNFDAPTIDAPRPPVDAPIDQLPDAYMPRCFLQCFTPHEICVDPDGEGGRDPYCGCLDDVACRGTGTCDLSSGQCHCGLTSPCVEGITECVNGRCVPVSDAGT